MVSKGATRASILFVCMVLGVGCGPTIEDVGRAKNKNDQEALMKYYRAGKPAVRSAALESLLTAVPAADLKQFSQELFAPSGDPALAAQLAKAWPRNTAILEALWTAMTNDDASSERNEILAKAALEADKVGFAQYVGRRVNAHKAALEADKAGFAQFVGGRMNAHDEALRARPKQSAALFKQLGELFVDGDAARMAFSASLELEAAAFAQEKPSREDAAAYLGRIRELATALKNASPAGETVECLAVRAAAGSFSALATTLDPKSANVPSGCPLQAQAVRLSAASYLSKLDIGTEMGRRVETKPAVYCCRYFGSCNRSLNTPAKCAQSNDRNSRWIQVKPPEYRWDPDFGPEQDAARLDSVADSLALANAMGAGDDQVTSLERSLREQARAQREAAPAQKKLADVEKELSDLRDRQKEYLSIGGFLIANVGDNYYEFATLHAVPSCMQFSCPTPPYIRAGKHAILHATLTKFASRGRFGVWATKSGTKQITTTNGFNETWDVYEEVAKEEVQSLDDEIQTAVRELTAIRAEQAKSEKGLPARRKELAASIAAVVSRWWTPDVGSGATVSSEATMLPIRYPALLDAGRNYVKSRP